MQRDRRLRVYDAHSWTGISLGLFLFVVCFTGSLALFHHEIQSWEDPARRLALPARAVAVQPLVDAWAAEFPRAELTLVGVTFPSLYEPYYLGRLNRRAPEGEIEFLERRWDPATGALLPQREDGLATWLLDFHRDLMWPDGLGGRQIGRGLVGIAGVIMLFSIVTGVLTHRKILAEFFTLRIRQTVRVKWKDGHNVLGVWSLPFSIMIAFTGAWLGIVALLLPITGLLVFKGDAEQVLEVLGAGPSERSGVEAPMVSFDEVAARPHASSGRLPLSVFATNWGDESAEYTVHYPSEDELRSSDVVRLAGGTGAELPPTGLLEPAASTRVIAALAPLHYGTYGGIALKLLYFALGIALSAMVALGNMVWIERRAHSAAGRRSPRFYDCLGRLTVGVCLGVVVASVAIFYVDALYGGAEGERIVWVGVAYFAAWLAAALYAFLPANSYRATRDLLLLGGVGLAGLPVVSAVAAGAAPWTFLAAGHVAAPAVDLALLLMGLACLLVAARLPRERIEGKPPRRRAGRLDTASVADEVA